MRIIVGIVLMLLLSESSLFAAVVTPGELIEQFYSSRKFLKKELLENMGEHQLSSAGKKVAEEFLYDYTVIETADAGRSLSYAEVEVKKRSAVSGITSQREFWKMTKEDGRWVIKNIYTPEEWQMKKIFRPGSSLPEKVEALAAFEYEYKVDDVPAGTPIQKAYAYIARRDIVKAYTWASTSVSQKKDAESYFLRGLILLAMKRQDEGVRDLKTAINLDRRYYYVLQNLMNQSAGGGGGSTPNIQESSSRTMKGGVQGLFKR